MGVEVIGAGMDWNNPYSCEQWSEKHNITYPLLDDSRGERIYNYFGKGVVPYNIVIDKNGKLIYSASGFNKDEIVNAIKPKLIEKGILVAGIDILGSFLTEINITSPTCFRELYDQQGINLAKDLIEQIEKAI